MVSANLPSLKKSTANVTQIVILAVFNIVGLYCLALTFFYGMTNLTVVFYDLFFCK